MNHRTQSPRGMKRAAIILLHCCALLSLAWVTYIGIRVDYISHLSAMENKLRATLLARQEYSEEIFGDGKEDIALPAEHVKRLGARVYSHQRFRGRVPDLDGFERRALEFVSQSPEVYSEVVGSERRMALRDTMLQSCLNCHNSHPDSPRDDWTLNDVRGAIEISSPVGIRWTLIKITGGAFLSFVFISFLTVSGLSYQTSEESAEMAKLFGQRSKGSAAETAFRFETFFDVLPFGAIITLKNGEIWRANRSLAKQFGYGPRAMRSMSLHDVVPPDMENQYLNLIVDFIGSGDDSVAAFRQVKGLHSDGHLVDLHLGIVAFRDGNEALGAGVTISKDMIP